ncbi:MAG: PEP-utilizing enzyme, partial [Dehalococcoidia bacterium]
AMARRFSSLDARALGDRQLARRSRELGRALGQQLRLLLTLNTASFGTFGILALMCEGWAGEKALAEELVMGLKASRTGEGSLRLAEIARQASGNPALRQLIQDCSPGELWQTLRGRPEAARLVSALDSYLDEYGHRCAGEVDIAVPRWREDPTPIMAAFREHVAASPGADPSGYRQTLRERWRRAEARALRRIAAWQRPPFLLALQQTRSLMSLREDPKFELLKLMLPLRRFILEMADRLVDRGLLPRPEDVFSLRESELHRFLRATPGPAVIAELTALVEERRQERELLDTVEPPEIIGPGGQPLVGAVTAPASPTRQLRGLGASPGRARGPARVVKTLADGDQVKSGEILVAPVMDPGWTCVFPLVSAIVTDLGGVLSHAAVVARELGVPAVVNTGSGSRRITTGVEIEVDGDRGTVTILEDGGLL